MKTTLIALLIFIFCTSINFSQWVNQNLPVNTIWIRAIDFLNENMGIAGGWKSSMTFGRMTIFYTSDGGNNWNSSQVPDSAVDCYDLQLINQSKAYACGTKILDMNPGALFLYSTNGGLSWNSRGVFSDSIRVLKDMQFIDSEAGYILADNYDVMGSAILKTTNGGIDWETRHYFEQDLRLNAISFYDINKGVAVGVKSSSSSDYGVILKTSDGGNTWSRTEIDSINFISDALYIHSDKIFITAINNIAGSGVYKLTGEHLSFEKIFSIPDSDIDGINGLQAGLLIIYGRSGPIGSKVSFVDCSFDTGKTWRTSTIINPWSELYFSNSEIINNSDWYMTGTYFQNGFILHTSDSGGLPVELISFTAEIKDYDILLNWITASEINNKGFVIERKVISNQSTVINEWNLIDFVKGKETTTEKQFYSFTDQNLSAGKYQYRLKQIDFDGSFEYSNVIEAEINIPNKFSLSQNYPNPFNPSTVICYQLAAGSQVTLMVYDVLGNEVATLVNEEKQPGVYEVEFDASQLSSGIYFYKLKAGNFTETKKMILLK
jgi:hypothetical protein